MRELLEFTKQDSLQSSPAPVPQKDDVEQGGASVTGGVAEAEDAEEYPPIIYLDSPPVEKGADPRY